jgi:type VI secretion system protein VasG
MNLKGLFGRVNRTLTRTLNTAAGLAQSRTNYEADLEHILLVLAEDTDNDVLRIFRHVGVDLSRATTQLTASLDRFRRGNGGPLTYSPRVVNALSDAWLMGSVDYGAGAIRSGHLLLAMLASDGLSASVTRSCDELKRVEVETVRRDLETIVKGSPEDQDAGLSRASGEAAAPGGSTKALDQFTIDLTDRARKGGIDPVTGRDFEIRQLVDILMRRRQNNPILTGEAGVGKTAVVEGFALRVAQGDVPPALRGVAVRTLDLTLLQAGAGVKGEFENRLKTVIDEVKSSPQPIILFIDEAHTMIGAGGQAGQSDAANLLKPALARGELRTIAATTWSEYKKYFEKDAALARRFQVVKVEEPTPDQAVIMIRFLVPKLEKHHDVRILDEATDAAVRLSDRYLSGRQLPDKAVSVLDTACARLAINQSSIPGSLEDATRRRASLDLEIEVIEREQAITPEHDARLADLQGARQATADEVAKLEARWEAEKTLIEKMRGLRTKLEQSRAAVAVGAAVASDGGTAPDTAAWRDELARLRAELRALQGETPMVQAVVDAQTIADVISGWTGIPVGKMKGDEIATILSLGDRLGSRVLGQAHALDRISQRIQISRARLEDPRKPVGVFMLVGPSGVGKTETALALAEALYGGEQNLITINMSEYQEAHTVSSLKGSPPGYVGYGEGGVLTEAVRRKPYSVVLLDEVEKAHPDVMELFFQVFDKGRLEDGEGREIDFKNTVILLTSNAGTDTMKKLCADEETRPEPDALADALRPDLLKHFPPALLGRLMVIPFYPIADGVMKQIIDLQLRRVASRIEANHRARFTFDPALVDAIRARCTEVDSGVRNVEHIITRTLLPDISREVLSRMASGQPIASVHVTAVDGAFQYAVS